MQTRRLGLLALSWIWVFASGAYIGWGFINHAGLYRWLADLQIEKFGAYYPTATGLLPWLLLAGPALSFIRNQHLKQEAQQPRSPEEEAKRRVRVARNVALAGVGAGLIGIGAYVLAQSVPDGSEPAVAVDLATLGDGPVPEGRVTVRGAIDEEASSGVVETGRASDSATFYGGFRPEEGGKDEPLRLFVERRAGTSADAGTTQVFMAEQSGYLIENGLPALVLRDLESRNVRMTSPHYVLRPGAGAMRDPYYVVAMLGVFIFFVCLVVALIGYLQRNRARRAEWLEDFAP